MARQEPGDRVRARRTVCTSASAPPLMPTPSWPNSSKAVRHFSRSRAATNFETKRRRTSPTAIGRTPPSRLRRGYRGAPAIQHAMSGGPSPLASAVSAAASGPEMRLLASPVGIVRASVRWLTLIRLAPGAVPLWKELRALTTVSALKESLGAGGSSAERGRRGVPVGCLSARVLKTLGVRRWRP